MGFRNYIMEKMSKPIGIFIGRMQPITVAHWKIIKDAQRKYSQVYVIIIEGDASSKLEKNFMTFDDRTDMLKVTNPGVKPILAKIGFIPKIIEDNNIDTSNGIVIIAGTDRIDGYQKQFKDVKYKIDFDEIQRTDKDVSASKVRKAVENDDFKTYKQMIAPGLDNKKWFELFQKAMKVKSMEMMETIQLKEYLDNKKESTRYLIEDVNKHMTHLEDMVFLEDIAGIEKNIQLVGSILNTLDGKKNNITTKYDGAPAVIIGVNPENDKFFISTKGIFAKTPKVAYSEQDIDNLFSSAITNKLKVAFKYLKETKPNGIYQGDLLWTNQSEKKQEVIDGKKYVTICPNTITYAFPVGSDLAKDVMRAKVGVVFHTRYKGEIGNLSATFDVNKDEFKETPNVWLQDAYIQNVSSVNLEPDEISKIKTILNVINTKKNSIKKIQGNVIKLLEIYKNNRIRGNVGILPAEKGIQDFISFIEEKYENEINTLKTDNAKTLKSNERDRIIEYIDDNSENIMMIFKIYNWFVKIKMLILRKLNQIEGIGTFVKQGDEYKVTSPEGFVAISDDGSVVKLVDRLEFSRLNFTIPKNW